MGNGLMATRTPGVYERHGVRGVTKYLDTYYRAVPIREGLGMVSQVDAEDELRRRQAAIADGRPIAQGAIRSLTVQDALEHRWINHLDYKRDAAGALSRYAKWSRDLIRTVNDRLGCLKLSDLRKSTIEKYKTERATDGVGPRTIQAELQQLNMAINLLVDDEVIGNNMIARHCRVEVPAPAKIVLDDGEDWGEHWKAIYAAACKGWDKWRPSAYRLNRALLLCLYETGLRPIEAFRMKASWWEELRPGYWVISVPSDADKTGKRDRRVPVSERLWNACSSIVGGCTSPASLVFPNTATGEMRGKDGIRKTFDHAVARAGLEAYGYTVYCLRRTRITIWDTIDEGACRYAVGHAVGKDPHRRSYSRVTMPRLWSLVGRPWGRDAFKVVGAA